MADAWPETLPQAGLVGVSGGPQNNATSFQADVGPTIDRLKASIARKIYDFQTPPLNQTEYEAFVDFFEDTLEHGTEPFELVDPFTGVATNYKIRLGEQPYSEEKITADLTRVSFQVTRLDPATLLPPVWNSTPFPDQNWTQGVAISSIDLNDYFSGGEVATWTPSQTLPDGITISGAGILSGTPTDDTDDLTAVTINAANAAGNDDTDAFDITIASGAPVFSGAVPDQNWTKGVAITPLNLGSYFTNSPSTWTPSETLPAGISINSSGIISGTPTDETDDITALTVNGQNAFGDDDTDEFNITIADAPPSFTGSIANQNWQVGVAITPVDIAAEFSGGAVTSWTPSETLPAGISINGSGVMSGTPTDHTDDIIGLSINGSNDGGDDDTDPFNITIADAAPVFSGTVPTQNWTQDNAITPLDISSYFSGGAVTTWTPSESLPAGISINGSGVISGTPTDQNDDISGFSVNGSNDGGNDDTNTFDINIAPPADVTAPVISGVSVGSITGVGAVLTFTSDEAGTAYWMVDTNATRTAAQVKTGGGVDSDSQAATATAGQTTDPSTGGASETGYYFHLMIEDGDSNQSTVSSTSFTTADVTAPTLSTPTDAADGTNAGTGSVDTNEGNGTLYWVVTQSATSPSAAQVKAGNDHTGSAADDSGNQSVSGIGTQNLSPAPSGLTAETTYYIHYMHEDSANNQSNVASADGFTTEAESVAAVLTSPTDTAAGTRSMTGSVSTDIGDGTLYWVIVPSAAAAPNAAQVQAGTDGDDTAATSAGSQAVSGTGAQNIAADWLEITTAYKTYYCHVASGVGASNVAAASGFTTTTPTYQDNFDRNGTLGTSAMSDGSGNIWNALVDDFITSAAGDGSAVIETQGAFGGTFFNDNLGSSNMELYIKFTWGTEIDGEVFGVYGRVVDGFNSIGAWITYETGPSNYFLNMGKFVGGSFTELGTPVNMGDIDPPSEAFLKLTITSGNVITFACNLTSSVVTATDAAHSSAQIAGFSDQDGGATKLQILHFDILAL